MSKEDSFPTPEHFGNKKEHALAEVAFYTKGLAGAVKDLSDIDAPEHIVQGLRKLGTLLPKLADGDWYRAIESYANDKISQSAENLEEMTFDKELKEGMDQNYEVIREDIVWAMEAIVPIISEIANGIEENIREAKLMDKEQTPAELLEGNISEEELNSWKEFAQTTLDNLELFKNDILNMEGTEPVDTKDEKGETDGENSIVFN